MEPGPAPGSVFSGRANRMPAAPSDASRPCPVCAGVRAAPLGAKRGHAYQRCTDCGLVYACRLPSAAEYATEYGRYGGNRPSVTAQLPKLWPLVTWARRRRMAPGPARFLDVGCNTGYNTEAARRLGCEAHGLETNPKTLAIARGLHPQCRFHGEPVEALAGHDGAFDAVYCSEVIEHTPDPRAFLGALTRLAAPSAVLFLTTPDAGHWRVPRDVLRWRHLIPVEHLHLFALGNLTRLLADCGWRVAFRLPTTRTNLRLYCVRSAATPAG